MSQESSSSPVGKRVSLLEMPLDIGIEAEDVIRRFESGNTLLTYLNPYTWSVARSRPGYVRDLEQFDLVVCDGVGVRRAAKRLLGVDTAILTPDMFGIADHYLRFAAAREFDLCLVGGAPGVAVLAGERIGADYLGIQEVRTFEGFAGDPDRARDYIVNHSTSMVLAGMGMGPQEAFLLSLRRAGWQGIGICVGGFLDKLANPALDYPEWSKRIGLRFVGRLANEPRRMVKRYFWDYRTFLWRFLLAASQNRKRNNLRHSAAAESRNSRKR